MSNDLVDHDFSDSGRDLNRFPHGWYVGIILFIAVIIALGLFIGIALAGVSTGILP